MHRRLATILAAEAVTYSRLMGLDEAGTHAAWKSHRTELIDIKIAEYQGRVVKHTGDGFLAEFPSVVNAVACAATIQQGMRARNAGVPQDRRIEFRIGINLGDVIVEAEDIYGDGVNLAARLESIAKPGGIAVTAAVRDNVGNRLDLRFEDLGEQRFKNIDRPVRAYSVSILPSAQGTTGPQEPREIEKPSIAVLPFNNMSGDPEQEYFSDGITEDIITDLSKVSGLFVVARNTTFTYKGKPANVQQVSQDLRVRFILEGSVRKVGSRVRVTAQLVEGKDGGHLWADRYDRDLTDIFAIQDEITHSIVDQLKVRLLPEERKVIGRTPTENLRGLCILSQGAAVPAPAFQNLSPSGEAHVRKGSRTRSPLCAGLCWHRGLRFLPLLKLQCRYLDRRHSCDERQGAGLRGRTRRSACLAWLGPVASRAISGGDGGIRSGNRPGSQSV